MSLYLAIDQGGHSSRVLIGDARGRVYARGRCPVTTRRRARDRIEQDPEQLVDSIRSALGEALDALPEGAGPIRAAGLATQRSSIVCWDRRTGRALSPVLSWQDRRAARWLAVLRAHEPEVHARTGLMLSPHYGASKLRWCQRHLPAVADAQRAGHLACGPLASFLLTRLLVERPCKADPANAARTLLWNLADGDWDPFLLRLFRIPADSLPRCVRSRHDFGSLDCGGRSLPLAVCTGDQSAAVFAHGPADAGTLFVNAGTGAFIQRFVEGRPPAPERLLASVVWRDKDQDLYTLEGTVNGAGSAAAAVADSLGLDADRIAARAEAWLRATREPPLFLNGVAGLGSPFWLADFPSRFLGTGTPAAKMVAVYESIVFLIIANVRELERYCAAPRQILITGGLASLDGLCQRLADLAGIPVRRPRGREATGRGLINLLAGRPTAWEVSARSEFEPHTDSALERRHAAWREAMQQAGAEF